MSIFQFLTKPRYSPAIVAIGVSVGFLVQRGEIGWAIAVLVVGGIIHVAVDVACEPRP